MRKYKSLPSSTTISREHGCLYLPVIALVIHMVLLWACTGESSPERNLVKGKKIIEYGWDVPTAGFVASHIRSMEQKPFDGIIITLDTREDHPLCAFDTRPWNEDLTRPLSTIDWKRFTDNFIMVHGSNWYDMDWLSDTNWQVITANMALLARAARDSRCKGIAFDPECYSDTNVWTYSASRYPAVSFTAVEDVVRARGRSFMDALQGEFPDIRIFSLSLFSIIEYSAPRLEDTEYALFKAFVEGLLDAAGPEVRLIEGCEGSYYFIDTDQFYDFNWSIRSSRILDPMPAALRDKYLAHVDIAKSLYMDMVLNKNIFTGETSPSPAYRSTWWTHNVYHALASSDEYVWCYSEEMDWWKGDVFTGGERGIRAARAMYEEGRPWGCDLHRPDLYIERDEAEYFAMFSSESGIIRDSPPVITSPSHGRQFASDETIAVRCREGYPGSRTVLLVNGTEYADFQDGECSLQAGIIGRDRATLQARSYAADGGHRTSGTVLIHITP